MAPQQLLVPYGRARRDDAGPEIRVREKGGGIAEENAALDRARAQVRARLERRAHAAPSSGGGRDAASEIAAAHLELLDDPELLAAARAAIEAGGSAGFAWRVAHSSR